jgi:hypothetical protein
MREEGLARQDRGAGADTGMIVAKDIVGGIKQDPFFFAGELLIDADPFHCSTSAGRFLFVATRERRNASKEYRTMLARAVPKIFAQINPLIFQRKSLTKPFTARVKGYGASYSWRDN